MSIDIHIIQYQYWPMDLPRLISVFGIDDPGSRSSDISSIATVWCKELIILCSVY